MKAILSLLVVVLLLASTTSALTTQRRLQRLSTLSNQALQAKVNAEQTEVEKMTADLVAQISKNLLEGKTNLNMAVDASTIAEAEPSIVASHAGSESSSSHSQVPDSISFESSESSSEASAPVVKAPLPTQSTSSGDEDDPKSKNWHDYSYADQEDWPELCLTGRKQGPLSITLDKAKVQIVGASGFPAFTFGKLSQGALEYNNFTYWIKDADSKLGSVSYDGVVYVFRQLHFHYNSEHKLENKRYPAELHFVYQKKGSSGVNDILTVAFLYDTEAGQRVLQKDPNWSGDVFLNDLALDAAHPPVWDQPARVGDIDLNVFRHITKTHFYTYEGSLSTPPCTESARWIVYPVTIPVLDSQLAPFKRFVEPPFPKTGNTRDALPVHVEHKLTLVVRDHPQYHVSRSESSESSESSTPASSSSSNNKDACGTPTECKVRVVMKECIEQIECKPKDTVEAEVTEKLQGQTVVVKAAQADDLVVAKTTGRDPVLVSEKVQKGGLENGVPAKNGTVVPVPLIKAASS